MHLFIYFTFSGGGGGGGMGKEDALWAMRNNGSGIDFELSK